MKASTLTILLFFLSSLFSFGQTKSKKVDILWGEEQKQSRRSTLSDIVAYDETGIYALKTERKAMSFSSTIYLEHYNNKMTLTKSVEINMEEQGKERDYEFIIQLKDEIYLFSSFKNQKLKENFLFVQSINKKTLQPNNDLKKVAEINYEGERKSNAGRFHHEISRDSSKVLVYYDLPYDKNESEKFGFHVFDHTLTELWKKQITLPYEEQLFETEDYEVDNKGNVHLLGTIFKDKRTEKRKGEPNYKYQILSYYNNGEELIEYPIKIEDKFLTDMQIAINDEQDIICGGFYSDKGTFSIKGSYFIKIDHESQEIETKSFKEFGIDFITQNMTNRQEKKANKKAAKGKSVELYEYDLDNITLRSDGGAVLIGEQYYIRVVTTTTTDANGNTRTTTNTYYHYNDIIVISISPEGDIEWTEKIPKRQMTVNDGGFFSSYTYATIGDKLYFIFTDNPKNLFYKGEGKLYNFSKNKDALVVLVELNMDGKQTKEALFSVKEADIIIRPVVCEQINKNDMVIFGQRKKTQRFAKITFDE